MASEPRINLVAVTTVYGDVALRARLAGRVLRLLGRSDVPVHAGTALPQSGRDVWWAGHEGAGVADLASEEIADTDGVDALLAAAHRHPGELFVVAIGPLTNVAAALDRDPSWAAAVRQLVVMGGEFARGLPEHNVDSDVTAAETVFAAGIPSLWVGLDVTTTVRFDETDLAAVTASGSAVATMVDRQVRIWWRHIGQPSMHPHDPLAVLAMLEPELFAVERRGWRVETHGPRLGALVADRNRQVIEYATRVDVAAARASLRSRLTATLCDHS